MRIIVMWDTTDMYCFTNGWLIYYQLHIFLVTGNFDPIYRIYTETPQIDMNIINRNTITKHFINLWLVSNLGTKMACSKNNDDNYK